MLIDGEEKVGIISTPDALRRAEEKGMDLVEVAPQARPPVCKIMDYSNYIYSLKKKQKKQKKASKTEIKTIRLSIRTDKHDMETKAKQAQKFLGERNLVKVVLIFHGREITHPELAIEKMQQICSMVEDVGVIEQKPLTQGRQMIMILKPAK